MATPSNHQSQTDKAFRDFTQTPRWLFEAFNSQYHYVLDAAALHESALLPRYYTPEQDSLSIDWSADLSDYDAPTVWLNPPYSDILPWVEKAHEQQQKGVGTTLLVPHDNRTQWWPAQRGGCKVIDIVGYYETAVYKGGKKKGQSYHRWHSGGIKFIDAKTGLEMPQELNKPMCLIDFNPIYLGQPMQSGFIAKNILFAMGQAAIAKTKGITT